MPNIPGASQNFRNVVRPPHYPPQGELVFTRIRQTLPLALKVRAGTHKSDALIHNPFSEVQVLVNSGTDLLRFDVLGLEAVVHMR